MRTYLRPSLLALLAACGGDDGPAAPIATTVAIDAKGTRLVAARELGGDWTVLTPDATGLATYDVAQIFEIVSVCSGDVKVVAFRAAPADVTGDRAQFAAACIAPAEGVIVNVMNPLDREVRVSAPSTGGVIMFATIGPRASERFSMSPGVGDLVVEDQAAGTAGVVRGATFSAGGTVTVGGVVLAPLTTRPFSPVPGPGAAVYGWLRTSGGGATFELSGGQVPTLAASLAQPGDRHELEYFEIRQAQRRGRIVDLDPASTAPVLLTPPPFITTATLTGDPVLSATYDASGEWPTRTLTADDFWRVVLYPGAGDPRGTATGVDPTAIPGWDPAWNLTATGSGGWLLSLTLERADATGRDQVVHEAPWPPLP